MLVTVRMGKTKLHRDHPHAQTERRRKRESIAVTIAVAVAAVIAQGKNKKRNIRSPGARSTQRVARNLTSREGKEASPVPIE